MDGKFILIFATVVFITIGAAAASLYLALASDSLTMDQERVLDSLRQVLALGVGAIIWLLFVK